MPDIHGHHYCAGRIQQHLPLGGSSAFPDQHLEEVLHWTWPNSGKETHVAAAQPVLALQLSGWVARKHLPHWLRCTLCLPETCTVLYFKAKLAEGMQMHWLTVVWIVLPDQLPGRHLRPPGHWHLVDSGLPCKEGLKLNIWGLSFFPS